MTPSTWNLEIESPAPAPAPAPDATPLIKAVTDEHKLVPCLPPSNFASAAGIQGDGSVGSGRQLNVTAAMPFGYVKESLDFVDFDKFECKQSLLEGGDLGQTSNGGCVRKGVVTYKPLPGVENKDEIAKEKKAVMGIIKAAVTWLIKAAVTGIIKEAVTRIIEAVEGYLLANPGAYA